MHRGIGRYYTQAVIRPTLLHKEDVVRAIAIQSFEHTYAQEHTSYYAYFFAGIVMHVYKIFVENKSWRQWNAISALIF